MTKLKLSHSAVNRYLGCPREYKYHYIEKYRAKVQSSALLFGTAIDKALESYVHKRDIDEAIEIFNETWKEQEINGKFTDLRFLLNFTYSDKDMDLALLNSVDFALIDEVCKVDSREEIDRVVDKKRSVGYKYLKKNEKLLFNFTSWLCLKHKGKLMLLEAKRVLDENLKNVIATQAEVKLENEEGDEVQGFADMLAEWEGYDVPICFDFKTSSRDYEADSVKTSPQLSGYVFALSEPLKNSKYAGYIVFNKNIVKNKVKICKSCGYNGTGKTHKTCDQIVEGKRCHGEWDETVTFKARSQVIIDTVSDLVVEHTIENFSEVGKAIKAGCFPRNLNNCIKYNGTVKCSFYSICHENNYDDVEKKVNEY